MAGANTPTQTNPKAVPGQQQITDAVLGNLEPKDPGANTFVAPSDQQSAALNQLAGYSQSADPFFNVGLAQQMGTAGGQYLTNLGPAGQNLQGALGQQARSIQGQYLDPMQNPAFQRLAAAREGLARQMFGEFAPSQSGQAVAAGTPYSSSARLAEVQRGGERIGTQAAQDIAQAGWQQFGAERTLQDQAARAAAQAGYGQYGAERGFQEAAAKYGTQLAPGLAQSVFTGNETLRSAEQTANEDAVRASLVAQGLDEQSIQNALNYMRNQQAATIQGPTPLQTGVNTAQGLMGLLQGSGLTLADLARMFGMSNMNTTPDGSVPTAPYRTGGADTVPYHDPGVPTIPTNADLYTSPDSPYNYPYQTTPGTNY